MKAIADMVGFPDFDHLRRPDYNSQLIIRATDPTWHSLFYEARDKSYNI
jgi:hypothetical protein